MKKLFVLLLLFSFQAQAIEPVPYDQAMNVLLNTIPRFTYNPTQGVYYGWAGMILRTQGQWGPQDSTYCLIGPLNTDIHLVAASLSSSTGSGTLRMVKDSLTGKWFWTNAYNIENDQGSLTWCAGIK